MQFTKNVCLFYNVEVYPWNRARSHTPSQYSLALATDGWQFMLYSMNTEFSEKILTAMKKHWLTKQLEQNKKRGCEEGKTQISNSKWKESEKQTWPKKLTSGLLFIPSMC